MRGCTITHSLALGGHTKREVALNEESALNEVVRYIVKEHTHHVYDLSNIYKHNLSHHVTFAKDVRDVYDEFAFRSRFCNAFAINYVVDNLLAFEQILLPLLNYVANED